MHFSLDDFPYKWFPHFFCLLKEVAKDSRLVVESNFNFHDCQEIMCWRQCTLFKNSTSIKMHNFKFWQQIYVSANIQRFQIQCWLLESHEKHFAKGKEAIFCDIGFCGTLPSDIRKLVPKPCFIWWQKKKVKKLLLIFPSSNVWNLCLYL